MSSLTFLLVTDFLHLWIWSLSRQFFMKSVLFHDKHWFNYLILLSCFILVEITHMLKLYFKQSLKKLNIWFSSVQFNHSFMSYSLRPHESQHDRPPCPSPTPRVYSNTCPLSQWCHPAISSSVIPFSSCQRGSVRLQEDAQLWILPSWVKRLEVWASKIIFEKFLESLAKLIVKLYIY